MKYCVIMNIFSNLFFLFLFFLEAMMKRMMDSHRKSLLKTVAIRDGKSFNFSKLSIYNTKNNDVTEHQEHDKEQVECDEAENQVHDKDQVNTENKDQDKEKEVSDVTEEKGQDMKKVESDVTQDKDKEIEQIECDKTEKKIN